MVLHGITVTFVAGSDFVGEKFTLARLHVLNWVTLNRIRIRIGSVHTCSCEASLATSFKLSTKLSADLPLVIYLQPLTQKLRLGTP